MTSDNDVTRAGAGLGPDENESEDRGSREDWLNDPEENWLTDEAAERQHRMVAETSPLDDDGDLVPDAGGTAYGSPDGQSAAGAETIAPTETVTPATPAGGSEPLLTAQAESDYLARWNDVQVSFVADPEQSVRDADSLLQDITGALCRSLEERRSELAANSQAGGSDTEALRLALGEYRSFIGVVLPK